MKPSTTQPHGEHELTLIEDDLLPGMRIYAVSDSEGNELGFPGEELDSLTGWWMSERKRNNVPVEEDTE